jgi:hypothetical protein
MQILITVLLVILLAVGGFFIGSLSVTVPPTQHTTAIGPDGKVDREREMLQAQKAFTEASGVMAERQHRAMIGGGIGAVVGLVAGILVSTKLSKRR